MRVVTLAELAVAIFEAAREEARPDEDPDALAAATLLYALGQMSAAGREPSGEAS